MDRMDRKIVKDDIKRSNYLRRCREKRNSKIDNKDSKRPNSLRR